MRLHEFLWRQCDVPRKQRRKSIRFAFIDNRKGSVPNGSDLGKQYSGQTLTKLLDVPITAGTAAGEKESIGFNYIGHRFEQGPIPASAYRVPTECLAINMHPGIIRVSSLMHCSCIQHAMIMHCSCIRHAMLMHGVQMLVRCCIDVLHSSLHARHPIAWHSPGTP